MIGDVKAMSAIMGDVLLAMNRAKELVASVSELVEQPGWKATIEAIKGLSAREIRPIIAQMARAVADRLEESPVERDA